MRILYDHQVFSLQNAGGQSRYFYELARFLTTIPNAQTEVWMGINGCVHPFRQLHPANTRVLGFPEWLNPGMARYFANELWSNANALFCGKLDVYHSTNLMRMPMVKARRVVATHHDCTHERFPQYFPDVQKIYWARRHLFSEVDAIICVSESSRRDLLQFYNIDPAKTCVVHHGLSRLPRSAEAAAELRRRIRRDYVLFVGMRPGFKNFDGVLRAFRESELHDSLDLVAVGGKPLSKDEQALIAKLGLRERVSWLPKASDEILAEMYAGATLFVYPSFNEGFGFPPLEAMSLDCPVLASRIASTEEVCHDAPFYFDPADQHAFVRELRRSATDDHARRDAIQRGRQVAALYSWEKCGRQTLAVYRGCQ
jgi:glycosyltransferase involved in cell wall biosynthesis